MQKNIDALAHAAEECECSPTPLEATDVAAVHAGYARRRRALLEAGVTLNEMRAHWRGRPPLTEGRAAAPGRAFCETFAVDGERLFIGSFNFDPRSASLNTEMGFVIASPALADRMETVFDRSVRMRPTRWN